MHWQACWKGMETALVCWLDHAKILHSWYFILACNFSSNTFSSFLLADSLMLLGMYVSHTTSILLEFCSCFMMGGIKT